MPHPSKTKAPKTTKTETMRSTVFVTAVGGDALAVSGELIKVWNRRDASMPGFEPYEPDDILDTALSLGLHFLAIQYLGNPDARGTEASIGQGASAYANSLETAWKAAARAAVSR